MLLIPNDPHTTLRRIPSMNFRAQEGRRLWPVSLFTPPETRSPEQLSSAATSALADGGLHLLADHPHGFFGVAEDNQFDDVDRVVERLGTILGGNVTADIGMNMTDTVVVLVPLPAGAQDQPSDVSQLPGAITWSHHLGVGGVWGLVTLAMTRVCWGAPSGAPSQPGLLSNVPFFLNTGDLEGLIASCSQLADCLGSNQFYLLYGQEAVCYVDPADDIVGDA